MLETDKVCEERNSREKLLCCDCNEHSNFHGPWLKELSITCSTNKGGRRERWGEVEPEKGQRKSVFPMCFNVCLFVSCNLNQ